MPTTTDAGGVVDTPLLARARAAGVTVGHGYAEQVAVAAELDAGDVAVECGYRSTARLLEDLWSLDPGHARRLVRHAAVLTPTVSLSGEPLPAVLPETAAAVAAGVLGIEQVRVIDTAMTLIAGVPGLPVEDVAAAEALLAEAAGHLAPAGLRKVADRLVSVVDPDGAAPADPDEPLDEMVMSRRRTDQAVRFTGMLHGIEGETFWEVVDSMATPAGPEDERSLSQRRAAAICELAAQALSPTGIAPRGTHPDRSTDTNTDTKHDSDHIDGDHADDNGHADDGEDTSDVDANGNDLDLDDGHLDGDEAGGDLDGGDTGADDTRPDDTRADGTGGQDTEDLLDALIPDPRHPESPDPESPDPESPGTESPGTESPGTESPGTESPGTESPGTGAEGTGSDSTGSDSTGSDSTGSDSTGSDSTGSDSTGSDSTGPEIPESQIPDAPDPNPPDPNPPGSNAPDPKPGRCATVPVRGRALLTVTMNYRDLADSVGHGLLDSGLTVTPHTVRRLACDAGIVPAILGTRSEPLDIGRLAYTTPEGIRRALHHRDRGCSFPGCTRRPRRCHAHHIHSWLDGGDTALDNLVLLCRYHHYLIHHSDWTITINNGRPWFTPPAWLDPQRTPRPGGVDTTLAG